MVPSATGTLGATPLAHALVYARNRRLTGRLELAPAPKQSATVVLWRGLITAVETDPVDLCPGAFLGTVLHELGYVDRGTLDETLLLIEKTKQLHGELLIERGAIKAAQRDEALVEQIHRKVQHLFSFADATTYAFYDAKAPSAATETGGSPKYGGTSVAVDSVGPVWRGIRDYPPLKFVDETVRRVGTHALRASTPERAGSARLPVAETALLQALAARPMTLEEMRAATELPTSRVDLLVYLLVIAKCVEAVSGVRTHPSTGALPVTMPSGPLRASSQHAVVAAAPPPPASSSSMRASRPSASSSSAMRAAGPLRTPGDVGGAAILERARSVEQESYFEVLGLPDGASSEAARAAFLRLAKTWHPDRLPKELAAVRAEVEKIFGWMTRAHQTLSDRDARREYVLSRGAGANAGRAPGRPRRDVVRDLQAAVQGRQYEVADKLGEELVAQSEADDAETLALVTWVSVRGGNATDDELRAAIPNLDRAVNLDRTSDQSVYLRGMVHKRLNNIQLAFRDFARAVQLNPDNIDAEREVRIFAMRVRKGSGEQKTVTPQSENADDKKSKPE
jgi:hypothetical protein